MKRLLIGISLAALGFFGMAGGTATLGVRHASAASPICALKDGLQTFVDARDSENTQLKLDARKGLLFIITDCTQEEITAAIDNLEQLSINDSDLTSAKDQLIGNLKEEAAYTSTQKARINDVGLQGTRDIARALKEWRSNTHLPQTGNANNFALWSKNQDLITVADNRLRQINQTLRTLKLSDREEIKTDVSDATKELDAAKAANQSARASLQRLENPDTTARLLRTSFNSLSAAYGSFLKVSDEVKKILPF